jgi:hypothetical protein
LKQELALVILRSSASVVSGIQEGVNISYSENRKEQMTTGVTGKSFLVCKSQFGRIHNLPRY